MYFQGDLFRLSMTQMELHLLQEVFHDAPHLILHLSAFSGNSQIVLGSRILTVEFLWFLPTDFAHKSS